MKRLVLVAVSAAGLLACGPGAKIGGGKQGAAEAFAAASKAAQGGTTRTGSGVDLTGAIAWKCPKGGEARLAGFQMVTGILGGGANVTQKFDIEYSGCGLADSSAGVAVYNGTITVEQAVATAATGVDLDQKFVGKLLVQGAFDDFLDANVSQKVSAGALAGTAAVAMTLKGTVATSAGSFAFDESLSVSGTTITAEVKTK